MSRSVNDDDGVTGWVLLIAFIFAVLCLIISRQDARVRLATPLPVNETVSPIAELMSRPLRSAEGAVFSFKDRSRAFEENKALRAELEAMRSQEAYLNEMKFKIAQYEKILSVQPGTELPHRRIVGRVVSEIEGPFVRAMLINLGQAQGVEAGNPVMSVDGLIGHVIQAGRSSSRVLLLGDLNSRIPVMSSETQARAILAGDNSDTPNLTYVGTPQDWDLGHKVMTSGDDGTLPQGLPVGDVFRGSDGKLKVRLQTKDSILDWVWVVPFTPTQAPEDAVEGADDAGGNNATQAPDEGAQ